MNGLLLTVLERLKWIDQWLFMKLNGEWTNPFFDSFVPFLRNSNLWIPLYLFLVVFVSINFRQKALWWILVFICTIALTDIVSSRIFKYGFERLRPCSDPSFLMHVRLLVKNCSGGYSFTSSHAANHFGMATFFFFTFRHIFKRWTWLVFVWAAAVCYAQIYVGVHYPFDILGGTVLGICFGLFTGMVFNKRFGFINFDKQPI